jgi:hypothetical protein
MRANWPLVTLAEAWSILMRITSAATPVTRPDAT